MDTSIVAFRLLQRNGHVGDLSIPTAVEEADIEEDPEDDPDFKGLADSSSEDETQSFDREASKQYVAESEYAAKCVKSSRVEGWELACILTARKGPMQIAHHC